MFPVGALVWTFSTWSAQDNKDMPAQVSEVLPGGLYKLACAPEHNSNGFVFRAASEMLGRD